MHDNDSMSLSIRSQTAARLSPSIIFKPPAFATLGCCACCDTPRRRCVGDQCLGKIRTRGTSTRTPLDAAPIRRTRVLLPKSRKLASSRQRRALTNNALWGTSPVKHNGLCLVHRGQLAAADSARALCSSHHSNPTVCCVEVGGLERL